MRTSRPILAARIARRGCCLLFALSLLALASCASEGSVGRTLANPAMARRLAENKLTLESLQSLNLAYADRYLTTIAAACDEIIDGNPDREQRAAAAQFRVAYITAIYDVVTSDDPVSQVVDLALVVTLQSQIYIDDALADQLFGDRADPLIVAIRRAREDIWALGAQLFSPDEQDYFDRLIWAWRKQNPHITFVGFVRFDEFAGERALNIVEKARSSGGFLAPVDEARRAVEDARMMAERVFFMAKRAPMILQWQAEAAADHLVLEPDVSRLLAAHEQIAPSLEHVADGLNALPDDLVELRDGVFREIDARIARAEEIFARSEGALAEIKQLLNQVPPTLDAARPITADLRAAAESLDAAASTAQQVVDRVTVPRDDPRFKPFDIDEYAAAATQLADAARELQQTIDRADQLLAGGALDDKINAHRAAIAADAAGLIDRLFWRLLILAAAVVALLAGYRLLTARARPRPAP